MGSDKMLKMLDDIRAKVAGITGIGPAVREVHGSLREVGVRVSHEVNAHIMFDREYSHWLRFAGFMRGEVNRGTQDETNQRQ